MRKQYKFIKHNKTDRYIRITNKTMLNIAAFNVAVYCILRNLVEIVLLLCFPNLLCLRSQIWKRYSFALFVRISAMQINRFTQIVTGVTSVWFNIFELHCAFLFSSFAWLLFILLALLECVGEFRLCGGDHGLCPLDSHHL